MNQKKMRKIAIYTGKGGVGKTFASINIAACLAKNYKAKVLCIDTDFKQADLTSCLLNSNINDQDLINEKYWFDHDNRDKYATFEDVRRKGVKLKNAIYRAMIRTYATETSRPTYKKIDVLALNENSEDSPELYEPEAIKNILSSLEDKYDYCIIDCSPKSSTFANTILEGFCDYVVCPLCSDDRAIHGMVVTSEVVENINKKSNAGLKFLGAFFNRTTPNIKECVSFIDEIREIFPGFIFETELREDNKTYNKVNEYGRIPFVFCRKSSKAAQDYISLTDEIVRRIDSLEGED